ncbi:MAG TPA: phosphopyruvate hydratase [Candidatus Syntrophoarchaeum butanivorans]|uniref:Enolase n=2 Tax=Candidatus Syntropharchaeum butanivorans TaxID=1839936 RepID=A0A1F2P825_9EURY|nr:MAG: enolase [Candidatus Syntrophoarchaeum butanivorans]RJS70489.1 MAG: phosphopyruvate hydratase [Candidatus Syntrophoarchaeum sp. WYZ-LMO15]HDM35697.1 phosphopyruvate hydratase [Candidatus Syntrophoarchaeum butanivorans]
MIPIEEVRVRKIQDSRGNPTIEVDVLTLEGWGEAAAPGGASTGKYEAKVLPVDTAIKKAEELVIPELIGCDVLDQRYIDHLLREIDGSDDFSIIGGNLAVAISMAVAKAAASSLGIPLYRYIGGAFPSIPHPLGNVIGGGAHARGATDIQEFLSIPVGSKHALDAVFANAKVHKTVGDLLSKRGTPCGRGDEGAWAAPITNEEALDLMREATGVVSDELGFEIRIGLDFAASELWDGNAYRYSDRKRSTEEQISYIAELIDRYNLYYVEDPLEEGDFEGFATLTSSVKCLICGDDLFVTNPARISRGIEMGSSNAVLIKPNQIGTLTDTFDALHLTVSNGLTPVISHRSGETTDDTIAHLAVGLNIPIIKTGVVGGERIAKLNELIRIEEEITS